MFKKKPKEEKKAGVLKILANIFKIVAFAINIIIQLVLIGYLGYSIYADNGNLIANIAIISASVLYLVFYIIIWKINDRNNKQAIKTAKHIKTIVKLLAKAFALATLIYGAIIASDAVGAFEIITMVCSIIGWMISVIIEIIVLIIEYLLRKIKKQATSFFEPITSVFDKSKRNKDAAAKKTSDDEKTFAARLGGILKKDKKEKSEEALVEEKAKPKLLDKISNIHLDEIFKKKESAAPEATAAVTAESVESVSNAEPVKPKLLDKISNIHLDEIFKKKESAAPEATAAVTAESVESVSNAESAKPKLLDKISKIRLEELFGRGKTDAVAENFDAQVGEQENDKTEETANV